MALRHRMPNLTTAARNPSQQGRPSLTSNLRTRLVHVSITHPLKYNTTICFKRAPLPATQCLQPNEKAVKRKKNPPRILVRSDGTITTPTATALDGIDDAAHPVLQEVGDVADGVAVGEEVPAAGAVAVVVEPGAEYQVSCCCEEEAACTSSVLLLS